MLSCFSSKAAQADWSATGQLFDIWTNLKFDILSDIMEWHQFKHDIYTLFNDQEDLSDFLVNSGFYEHLWSHWM